MVENGLCKILSGDDGTNQGSAASEVDASADRVHFRSGLREALTAGIGQVQASAGNGRAASGGV